MAKQQSTSEWTLSDWNKLMDAKRILADLVGKMDKAEKCGVDCQGYREIHAHMSQAFDNIQQEYMPQQPSR